MSPQAGSCQKLRNSVYISNSYAEKTVDSFFPDTVYIRCTAGYLVSIIRVKDILNPITDILSSITGYIGLAYN